jgi:hypothetical protein
LTMKNSSREIADVLRRALQEAAGVVERLDERRHFTGRLEGWRELSRRAEEELRGVDALDDTGKLADQLRIALAKVHGSILCEASDLPVSEGDTERDRQWATDFRKMPF